MGLKEFQVAVGRDSPGGYKMTTLGAAVCRPSLSSASHGLVLPLNTPRFSHDFCGFQHVVLPVWAVEIMPPQTGPVSDTTAARDFEAGTSKSTDLAAEAPLLGILVCSSKLSNPSQQG
jgi:hypothetical protein